MTPSAATANERHAIAPGVDVILAELTASLAPVGPLPPLSDRDAVLHTLEARADADPADADVRDALALVHAWVTADTGLAPTVAGIARESLVRWDAWSSTWTGRDVRTGETAMVRVLRQHASRDPLLRRQLVRDARALGPRVVGLRVFDGPEGPTLVAPLPGPMFVEGPRGGGASIGALTRLLTGTLDVLTAWEEAGVLPVRVDPAELRDAGEHLRLVVLTPGEPGPSELVHQLVTALAGWWRDPTEHAVVELIHGLDATPDTLPSEAAPRLIAALATTLAAERHALLRAESRTRVDRMRDRLLDRVERLDAAVPPPRGIAALGADLDGRTMVVRCDGRELTWGADGEEPVVVWDEDGFDVPAARRLVRARGSAGISERLNAEVGGDPRFAEAVARWTATALEVRTTRMMLAATR